MRKERAIAWATNAAVILMAAAIPFGAGMAFYTDNPFWLMLCGFIFIFAS